MYIFKAFLAFGNIVTIHKLKSSRNTNLNWKKYKYIVVGNKNSGYEGREWGDAILRTKKLDTNRICVIASVSKYMTMTPGSKYVIRIAFECTKVKYQSILIGMKSSLKKQNI